jgi:hypothetical protein
VRADDLTGLGQGGQVSPNGHRTDAKSLGETLDRRLTGLMQNLDYFAMTRDCHV